MQSTKPFSIAVPTSTILAHDLQDPFRVCVIEQANKHRGRLTLVGGRVELPPQNHPGCALDEWQQEAGGQDAKLVHPVLWAVKSDPNVDIRQVTLGKITNNQCAEELRDVLVTAHYGCPDCIYLAGVTGTPAPNDGEAKQCLFIDVRDVVITEDPEQSRFGAQHDLILAMYRLSLEGHAVGPTDFADYAKLRRKLIRMLAAI